MVEDEILNIYISKVDTTGCTLSTIKDKKISATKQLISSYINYHLEEGMQPKYKCVNLHVFARSQPQYLFTKSSKNPNKHVLGGLELLKWWKKILGQAFTSNPNNVKKWFYVPGDTTGLKAKSLINDDDDWIYGYPYDNESKVDDVIPKFDDDAKARWLDHLNDNNENEEEEEEKDDDDDDENDEINKTNVKEFWEVIGIGGEFSGGNVAGFFWVNIKNLTIENFKGSEYETNLLKNLSKNVGGITFDDEQEFVKILKNFFELEFYDEEITFKSSKDWSKIFDDLCTEKGIDDGILEFKVESFQEPFENENLIGTVSNSQSNDNKRKLATINNDDDSNTMESNDLKKVNVLSSSLIKRAKK